VEFDATDVRETTSVAPTTQAEGALFEGKSRLISNAIPIDVYIYSLGIGKIRVDL
jgi:hypothetical protein